MNRIVFEEGIIKISGCNDCPFCHYHERSTDYSPYCCINPCLNIRANKYHNVDFTFPSVCPLTGGLIKGINMVDNKYVEKHEETWKNEHDEKYEEEYEEEDAPF